MKEYQTPIIEITNFNTIITTAPTASDLTNEYVPFPDEWS